jgi:hypothetical protein
MMGNINIKIQVAWNHHKRMTGVVESPPQTIVCCGITRILSMDRQTNTWESSLFSIDQNMNHYFKKYAALNRNFNIKFYHLLFLYDSQRSINWFGFGL